MVSTQMNSFDTMNFDEARQIYKINLGDKDLFGMDDAAYEDFDLLKEYSIERKEYEDFYNEKFPFLCVKAPKGTGKTTIVRLFEDELSQEENITSILKFDSQISPSLKKAQSLSDWIIAWKKSISEAILLELSENETFVFDPDMIGVIERAENRGFRRQNFVGLVREHFNISNVNKAPNHELKDQEAILHRILPKKDQKIWLFLDEIDQYFNNDEFSIKKVGAMFLAARELTGYISNLTIRITIKPNVFAILVSRPKNSDH